MNGVIRAGTVVMRHRRPQPNLREPPTGLNGLGTVVFGSGTDPLLTPSFDNPSGSDGVSAFMVVERTGQPVNFSNPFTKGTVNAQWSLVWSNASQSNSSHFRNNTTTGNTASSPSSTVSDNTPVVFSGFLANAGIKQFFDGTELSGSQGVGTRSFGASSALTIGSSPDSVYSSNRFQGQIGELILVYGDYTTYNHQKIEGYLAWKWGLEANLPGDHPYKLTAPETPTISGIIRDRVGNPCQRKVYAISRPTDNTAPVVIAHDLSDPVTGEYELAVLSGEEVTRVVVSEDDANPLLNDIVDRVIPA